MTICEALIIGLVEDKSLVAVVNMDLQLLMISDNFKIATKNNRLTLLSSSKKYLVRNNCFCFVNEYNEKKTVVLFYCFSTSVSHVSTYDITY